MSLWERLRALHYFDLIALGLLCVVAAVRVELRDSLASPPLLSDIPGFWVPATAAALLAIGRHRARAQLTPWLAGGIASLILVALAAVFWRGHVMVFMLAVPTGAVLLLAGIILRARRIAEPLARVDLFGLIALAAGTVLTIVLAEAVLRFAPGLFDEKLQAFLHGADPSNFGVAHPYIGHLHSPHSSSPGGEGDHRVTHNVDGLGFRNPWPWPERSEIVAIGDSVTFGQHVADDEAWPSVLAARVAPVRVINLGLIGAGPQQYLRLYETFGRPLEPRLVLLGVFARNDFWDAGVFEQWLEAGAPGNYMVWRGFGRPPPVRFDARSPLRTLRRVGQAYVIPALRRSYIFALLVGLRGGAEAEPPPPPVIYTFEDGRTLQLQVEDFTDKAMRARPGERIFELTVASLRQMHERTREDRTQLLVVLLPGKEETYLPLLGRETIDPARALKPELERMGIEYLDLTPAFRARAAAGEQLFYTVDGHPNAAGQALIAELVYDHLARHAQRYGLDTLESVAATAGGEKRAPDDHRP